MRAKSSNVSGTALKAHKQSIDFDGLVWKNLSKILGPSEVYKDATHAVNSSLRDKMIALGTWEEQ